MRRLRYVVLDVFTDRPFAGNALAVFPEAEGLSTAQMQMLAREMNLSETTFVLTPQDPRAAVRVRIFTPFEELPYAGHPSVGTHWLLAREGRHALQGARTRLLQEVGAGLLPIDLVAGPSGEVDRVDSTQAPPRFGPPLDAGELAGVLALEPGEVGPDGLPAQVVDTGVSWLLVPLSSRAALERARLSADARERLLALSGANRVYPFALEGFEPDALTSARGLLAGEFEDPVTGSASGCLGAYLARHGRLRPGADGVASFTHTQGHLVGRPGRVHVQVEMEAGEPRLVRVGGTCVRTMEGHALVG